MNEGRKLKVRNFGMCYVRSTCVKGDIIIIENKKARPMCCTRLKSIDVVIMPISEVYIGPSQTSKIEFLVKIINS